MGDAALDNPVWHALTGPQATVAEGRGAALRYRSDVAPFAGLPDEDVAQHQKDDAIGHRPTWFIGVNPWAKKRGPRNGTRGGFAHRFSTVDPLNLFAEQATAKPGDGQPERQLKRAERKCLRQLNLEDNATKADIKARFKELVKRLHPDHNHGDRRSEDKLREVIQAYNYLRQAGLA